MFYFLVNKKHTPFSLNALKTDTAQIWYFHNPLNSDMDHMIFNLCMWSFCIHVHKGTCIYSLIWRTCLSFSSKASAAKGKGGDGSNKKKSHDWLMVKNNCFWLVNTITWVCLVQARCHFLVCHTYTLRCLPVGNHSPGQVLNEGQLKLNQFGRETILPLRGSWHLWPQQWNRLRTTACRWFEIFYYYFITVK